ncbi:MAG: LCP family protein, partial [Armatimonadetes bacterium]|nr:LCP family protein [Armatimonadota bacterium]
MDSNRAGKGLRQRLKELELQGKVNDSLRRVNSMGSHGRFAKHARWKKRALLLSCFLFAFFILPMALGIWSGWRSSGRKTLMRQIAGVVCRFIASPDLIFAGRDRVNILLIGRDVDRDRYRRILPTHGRADTIIVVSLCRSERKAYILSIPRDTAVLINGHGLQKINAAHSFGGPELLVEVLRDQLCIGIDYYARTSFEGFKKIVDAVGGVWLYVEKDMNYDDNWGNLHIHLKKGWQWLDGEKAHQYVRFRHDAEGDIGRTKRQRKFLEALAVRLTSPSVLPRLPSIIR